MAPLFTEDQLADHVNWFQRAWHLARRVPPLNPLGWRTLQASATVTGIVDRGEASSDGDTCFDIIVGRDLRLHCEVDPADLAFFRPALLALEVGKAVEVSGVCCCDNGHGTLELHPVTALGEFRK